MVAPDRERLRRAFGGGRQPAAGATPAAGDLQRRLLLRAFGVPERRAPALPDGETAANAAGTFWRRLLRYPLAHRHGAVPLGAALQADGARIAELSRSDLFARLDVRECLFVDTETTGLGGAGTVVFTVGLGWFEGEEFVLEQLFLRRFGEEAAVLQQVADRLRQRPVPVSYVGKSFDRHRIAARLAVHRMQAPILTERHLDLYHLARRAWRGELPDHRLRTVEELRLGLLRHDDLPGSEAPLAFLDWLRDGSGPVDRVLEHNRLDVLSLAALLGVLARGGA